jgi:hypothetical protein
MAHGCVEKKGQYGEGSDLRSRRLRDSHLKYSQPPKANAVQGGVSRIIPG